MRSWLPAAPDEQRRTPRFFGDDELAAVRRYYETATDAPPTPLRRLRGLAAELGVGDVLVKDESGRFGLPAFKIVGARYAIARLVEAPGPRVSDLSCATAGNHGRAVARAARAHGLRAHVYVPAGTTPARISALRAEGADVVVTDVDYDETVRLMAGESAARGWRIVSDTAWDGYEQIPRWIMAGYTWLMEEAGAEWHDRPPGVVIVQAGVGSLAGAVAGWLDQLPAPARPKLVVVEPEGSACVLASLRASRRVNLPACAPTEMVGLRCAEVSPLGWRALADRVDAAVTISNAAGDAAVARLASPASGDPVIRAGASGAAGLAALVALTSDDELQPLRERLNLGTTSTVMIVVTEGATGVSD